MELEGLPLAEIRRRLSDGPPRLAARVLAALQRDPRAGARRLAAELEQRRRVRRDEARRLSRLFAFERALAGRGFVRVAGIDEVGMGPLAGPVVSAAVVLPYGFRPHGLTDSKLLQPAARERLAVEIRSRALAVSIAWATPEEIDRLNIYQAGLLAMQRAAAGLDPAADFALVDARAIPQLSIPQQSIVGGDACVGSIAAASILAKVYRDAWMRDLDRRYPGYGFAHNAGYATLTHRRALEQLGPAPPHRYSFEPVRLAARQSGSNRT